MRSHLETARQFGYRLAIKRSGGNTELSSPALASAFYALAESLTNDNSKVKQLAVSAKTGFDQLSKQNGWPTFKQIHDEDQS